jgi:hypothetical protein
VTTNPVFIPTCTSRCPPGSSGDVACADLTDQVKAGPHRPLRVVLCATGTPRRRRGCHLQHLAHAVAVAIDHPPIAVVYHHELGPLLRVLGPPGWSTNDVRRQRVTGRRSPASTDSPRMVDPTSPQHSSGVTRSAGGGRRFEPPPRQNAVPTAQEWCQRAPPPVCRTRASWNPPPPVRRAGGSRSRR